MIYNFDDAIKRWKSENENGILKYYNKKYKDMKPGTVESYSGYLKNFRFLNEILSAVGIELPEDFEWSKVPEDDNVCLAFEANGDLSSYTLDVYYEERLMNDDPDYMIVSSKGSLDPEQFCKIKNYLSTDGKIEATIFLGFLKEANADSFDELTIEEFVCRTVVEM